VAGAFGLRLTFVVAGIGSGVALAGLAWVLARQRIEQPVT
jgi:hypothetical protein